MRRFDGPWRLRHELMRQQFCCGTPWPSAVRAVLEGARSVPPSGKAASTCPARICPLCDDACMLSQSGEFRRVHPFLAGRHRDDGLPARCARPNWPRARARRACSGRNGVRSTGVRPRLLRQPCRPAPPLLAALAPTSGARTLGHATHHGTGAVLHEGNVSGLVQTAEVRERRRRENGEGP